MKRFDRKFGEDFLSELTTSPAVYLFFDEADVVIYVGKAKNARRRLAQYRNASRRKAHRKMRTVVREASRLEVRPQPTEAEALLVENRLIRSLHPRYNVDGAFDFLYPAIGTAWHEDRLVLVLTTEPDRFESLDYGWHGSFRPRSRAREAFDALTTLFGHIGHLEPRSRLPAVPDRRGTRLVAVRRVPIAFLGWTRAFLDGEDCPFVAELSTTLLESTSARRAAAEIEAALKFLADFHEVDAKRLRAARIGGGLTDAFVPGWMRDELFIRDRTRDRDECRTKT